jgi:hypothetical protein
MSNRDDAAAEYYEDPENRQLMGSGRRRAGQAGRLSSHVPVRFSATVIDRVKELAAEEGKTVSSWIREVVEREVLRRERSRTQGMAVSVRWDYLPPSSVPNNGTIASGAEDFEKLVSLTG